jgi:hypothetical protein
MLGTTRPLPEGFSLREDCEPASPAPAQGRFALSFDL